MTPEREKEYDDLLAYVCHFATVVWHWVFRSIVTSDSGVVRRKNGVAHIATNTMNQMLLTMLGAVSSFELAMINERRAEGQTRARADGKHMGRSAKLSDDQVATIRQRAATESKIALADEYGVSRATLYAAIKAA